MGILLIGINHHSAPVEVREKVAFHSQSMVKNLSSLKDQAELEEVAILNTCNRTEIYYDVECQCAQSSNQQLCDGECSRLDKTKSRIVDYLDRYSQLPDGSIKPFLYEYKNSDMVRHTMQVASGLNSMVVGEPQILGQMKRCYQDAVQAGTVKKVLFRLFETVFSSAKKVRSETGIGSEPVSIAYIAVKMTTQFYTSLENKKIILIGAGDTIRLVCAHITSLGSKDYMVANRDRENAMGLVQGDAKRVIALTQLEANLEQADIIISCTASDQRLLNVQQIKRVMAKRHHQRLLLIDLAVPRDIDPEVAKLPQVYLYSVDHLSRIAQNSLSRRLSKSKQADQIIIDYEHQFMQWLNLHNNTDLVRALRKQGEQLRNQLVQKYSKKIQLGNDAHESIEKLSQQLTNKLMHLPTVALRKAIEQDDTEIIEAIRKLYEI